MGRHSGRGRRRDRAQIAGPKSGQAAAGLSDCALQPAGRWTAHGGVNAAVPGCNGRVLHILRSSEGAAEFHQRHWQQPATVIPQGEGSQLHCPDAPLHAPWSVHLRQRASALRQRNRHADVRPDSAARGHRLRRHRLGQQVRATPEERPAGDEKPHLRPADLHRGPDRVPPHVLAAGRGPGDPLERPAARVPAEVPLLVPGVQLLVPSGRPADHVGHRVPRRVRRAPLR
mmetsp:Transcript_30913/g.81184  ORF Transcript_30913/g.81184 Transcript_30913/m.81184 type:complete len:229 (+) Transcript_30913:1272-1958(+)